MAPKTTVLPNVFKGPGPPWARRDNALGWKGTQEVTAAADTSVPWRVPWAEGAGPRITALTRSARSGRGRLQVTRTAFFALVACSFSSFSTTNLCLTARETTCVGEAFLETLHTVSWSRQSVPCVFCPPPGGQLPRSGASTRGGSQDRERKAGCAPHSLRHLGGSLACPGAPGPPPWTQGRLWDPSLPCAGLQSGSAQALHLPQGGYQTQLRGREATAAVQLQK